MPDSSVQCRTVQFSAGQFSSVPDSSFVAGQFLHCRTVPFLAGHYYSWPDIIIPGRTILFLPDNNIIPAGLVGYRVYLVPAGLIGYRVDLVPAE